MRAHLNVTVTDRPVDEVLDCLVGVPVGRRDDARAIVVELLEAAFLSEAAAHVDGDWASCDVHFGGYPEIEIIDLDSGDGVDEGTIGLSTAACHVEDDLCNPLIVRSVLASAVTRIRARLGVQVAQMATLERVGLDGIDVHNLSDATTDGLLDMLDAVADVEVPGVVVFVRAERGFGDLQFWLTVTDTGAVHQVSEFRCDGFLAPAAQVADALARHAAAR
jgi:hypothetical protein